MFKKIFKSALKHKIITGMIIIAVGVGGYFAYPHFMGNKAGIRYVLAAVEKGTLIVSVSGSGQVAAVNQVDIKSQNSGEIVYLGIKDGQEVKKGAVLARLESDDFQSALEDAQISLEQAQINLEKVKNPVDDLTLMQSENSLTQAAESLQKAQNNLQDSYDNSFDAVETVFLNLPSIMNGLDGLLFGNELDRNRWNLDWYLNQAQGQDFLQSEIYRNQVYQAYITAQQQYDDCFKQYKATSRNSSSEIKEALLVQALTTIQSINDVVKATNNFIDYTQGLMEKKSFSIPTAMQNHQTKLDSYISQSNSFISQLSSTENSLADAKLSIISSQRSVDEKTASLAKLKAGPEAIDVKVQELIVKQKEKALATAKTNLANCVIIAPFNAVVAKVNVENNQTISNGTALATLITKENIAEISLNEIDAAKVKTGQKATITFDAIDGLSITGTVIEVDALGTVLQGVVSYTVKIGFDTQDDRVKPGMSVSTAIVADVKNDVLLVPNSAIKSQSDSSYVEMLNMTTTSNNAANLLNSSGITSKIPPIQQIVEVGLSNDSYTEIISGLDEGDLIVSRTITSSANNQNTSTQNRSVLQSFGTSGANRGPEGGTFRVGQ